MNKILLHNKVLPFSISP